MKLAKRPIFIMGTQRSGTTLLRLILNAHSQIAIPRESAFLIPFLERRYIKRPIPTDTLKSFGTYISSRDEFKFTYEDYADYFKQLNGEKKIALKDFIDDLFSSICHRRGKTIWGNKTPSFFRKIDILYALFPDAQFVHIVRDGRDVFDSWRKMDPSKDNAAVVALDWCYKLHRIEKSFERIPASNKITLRYEDLLDDPKGVIKSVCAAIGVEFEVAMLDFYKTSHNHTIPDHSKLIFRPLDKGNKHKWENNLSSSEVKIFNLLAGRYLRKYGYELEEERLDPVVVFGVLKNLISGLPSRLAMVLRHKKNLDEAVRKDKVTKADL